MQQAITAYGIDDARASDVDALIDVDCAASTLFAPTGLLSEEALSDHVPAEVLTHAADTGDLFTVRAAEGEPVGSALVSPRGGTLYLDQISVHPDHGRKGLGAALLGRVVDEAKKRKIRRITLSTFRDLPWNGPSMPATAFARSSAMTWPSGCWNWNAFRRRIWTSRNAVSWCVNLAGCRRAVFPSLRLA